jgi:hypothetical protein
MCKSRFIVRLDRKQFLTNVTAEMARSSLTLVPTTVIQICSFKGNLEDAGRKLHATRWAAVASCGRLQLEEVAWSVGLLCGAWSGHAHDQDS